jgi:hypothetical protein
MKKVLFEFLDVKYSGKDIVIQLHENRFKRSKIYWPDNSNNWIYGRNDFIMMVEIYSDHTDLIVNSSVRDHILQYMNHLGVRTIESYVLDWCKINVKQ